MLTDAGVTCVFVACGCRRSEQQHMKTKYLYSSEIDMIILILF